MAQDGRLIHDEGGALRDQGGLQGVIGFLGEGDDGDVGSGGVVAQLFNRGNGGRGKSFDVNQYDHCLLGRGRSDEFRGLVDDDEAVPNSLEPLRDLGGDNASFAEQHGEWFVHAAKVGWQPKKATRFRSRQPVKRGNGA